MTCRVSTLLLALLLTLAALGGCDNGVSRAHCTPAARGVEGKGGPAASPWRVEGCLAAAAARVALAESAMLTCSAG
ncbi:MAG TPA: hypothetical protein VGD62_01030 [Acidobacteriaceae bacterium]